MPTPVAAAASDAPQACDRCHRRKTRCDKVHPECGPCRRAQASCVYSERAKQPVYRRRFVENLERRIHQLEAANRRLSAAAAAASSAPPAATSPDVDETIVSQAGEENGRPRSRNDSGTDDIANEVSYLSTSAGGDRQFLGSTSGILLASLVNAGVPVNAERLANPSNSTLSPGTSPVTRDWGADDRSLPPEQLARHLIEAYLAHDHLSYPFLHPRAVRATVDCIYSDASFSRTHAFEAFMFNMILAIATSQVYKFNWQALPDAETHHQRAAIHLNQVLSEGGLRALQAMLLLCQFRLGSSTTDASGSLWHIVGIAARMCFELGLHRETMYRLNKPNGAQGDISHLSPKFEENEVRRRCFWSAFVFDRMVSITLGRPLAICIEDIDVELPTEDLDEVSSPSVIGADDQTLPRIAPSYRTRLFVHLVRYRDICGRCLTSLHRGSKAAAQSEDDLHRIRSGLAAELDAWRADTNNLDLPELDLMTRLAEARSSFQSKAWYEMLYHNGVLLLYRPSVTTVSAANADSQSLQHIFSAAHQSITLYAYLLRSRKINFLWITMHSVFIAGLSYVYALSRHFREKRRRGEGPRTQLAEEPSIVDIVNCCRACSNVLVAISERCNAQKNCHEVFDRLSDAVLADAVAVLSGLSSSGPVARSSDLGQQTSASSVGDARAQGHMMDGLDCIQASFPVSADDEFAAGGLQPSLAVDNALRDCFPDLQRMGDSQWGDDAILQLSTDWLGEIDQGGGLLEDWNLQIG
ncbi:uncharacterized protein E0L32_005792 [Thyridium curvatum]|uniref:Zn(2)-C6 fungal-type domain-containing protein n=1 Tax=Thyridium curvatum TaxID=1093900 RepID=A0A507BAM9_9PEZI|nr:uncharacterized protein E0L32_005792 [Thyridium curvatum]TPX13848.1 hypothetical protein E0L32_005792 [Thyridium curvatum]